MGLASSPTGNSQSHHPTPGGVFWISKVLKFWNPRMWGFFLIFLVLNCGCLFLVAWIIPCVGRWWWCIYHTAYTGFSHLYAWFLSSMYENAQALMCFVRWIVYYKGDTDKVSHRRAQPEVVVLVKFRGFIEFWNGCNSQTVRARVLKLKKRKA